MKSLSQAATEALHKPRPCDFGRADRTSFAGGSRGVTSHRAFGGHMATDSIGTKPARVAAAAMLGAFFSAAISVAAFAQDAARIAAGEAAWDKAGCLKCHGSTGEGGAGG